MKIELDKDQKAAAIDLLLGCKTRKIQTLGGYAGTGKTTLVDYLAKELPRWAVCAFTGKATDRLRSKGIATAETIHSTIYKVRVDPKTKETHYELKKKWELGFEGFLVDEASMVGVEQFNDMLSFRIPIIAVGDHGQLPPVGDDAGLMNKPDITLTTLHRNAGPISRFAEHLRNGGDPLKWSEPGNGEVYFIKRRDVDDGLLQRADQVICAFNKSRVSLNRQIRRSLGIQDDNEPIVGDRVMCLLNDRERGIFNGQQGVVSRLIREERLMEFAPLRGHPVDSHYLEEAWNAVKLEKKPRKRPKQGEPPPPLPFDFCYAITCHKAQGDEWDKGIVFPEYCDLWEFSRWAYTAASRFKKKLVWVI